jgi:hypothetical protein
MVKGLDYYGVLGLKRCVHLFLILKGEENFLKSLFLTEMLITWQFDGRKLQGC